MQNHPTPRPRGSERRIAPHRYLRATTLAAALTFATALPALAQDQQTVTGGETTHAWLVILAIAMVATGVQLLIEVIWNYLEWFFLNVRGWTPTRIKSPQFQQFKSGTSLLVGAVLGVLIANATGMRIFQYFEPLVPDFVSQVGNAWDVLLTGLLVGAITKPVHDIFGLIGKAKELLGNSAIRQRELASDALASGVLKLAQSEAQALVDVPGIGPARLPVPGELGDDRQGNADQTPTERYVDLLHNRTMM